jgi:ribosome-associated protein
LSEELQPAPGVRIPVEEVELRASRSGGPGGQHANVTASRIEASFDVRASASLNEEQRRRLCERLGPRITASAQDTRSQARNRRLALARLEARLAAALRPRKRRRPTRPGRAAKERRVQAKRRRGQRKEERRRPRGEW